MVTQKYTKHVFEITQIEFTVSFTVTWYSHKSECVVTDHCV